ncbi:MAG: hypothetical protein AAF772_05315 [Acidobacteriota bacterium]
MQSCLLLSGHGMLRRMRLSELCPQQNRALTLQVKRMVKRRKPAEAAKLEGYWQPDFLLRFFLWCEAEMVQRPDIATPFALVAPRFAENWRDNMQPAIDLWPRYVARAYIVRGTALRMLERYAESRIAYRHGEHILIDSRHFIPKSDVCDFYQRLAILNIWEQNFELAQVDLEYARSIALRTNNASDLGASLVALGSLYAIAAEKQTGPRLKGSSQDNRYEAAVHFNSALRVLDGRSDFMNINAALMNLFYISTLEKDVSGREDILQQMEATQERYKSRKQRATKFSTKFNWARAVIYGSVGDHETARELLQDCLKKFRSFKMKDHCIAVLLDLAHIEETTGNRDALAAIAEQATPLIEEHAKNSGPETHRLRTWLDACMNKLEPEPATMRELRAALSPFASLPAANEARPAIESA